MKWMTTCRETTELASRAMDQELPLADRMALRIHLAICGHCSRFNRQIHEMRQMFRAETAGPEDAAGLSESARRRIGNELQKGLDP